jgi:hypothetical protein
LIESDSDRLTIADIGIIEMTDARSTKKPDNRATVFGGIRNHRDAVQEWGVLEKPFAE